MRGSTAAKYTQKNEALWRGWKLETTTTEEVVGGGGGGVMNGCVWGREGLLCITGMRAGSVGGCGSRTMEGFDMFHRYSVFPVIIYLFIFYFISFIYLFIFVGVTLVVIICALVTVATTCI